MATTATNTANAKLALDTAIAAAEAFIQALDDAQAAFPAAEPGVTYSGSTDIANLKGNLNMQLNQLQNSRRAYDPIVAPMPMPAPSPMPVQ